MLLQLQVLKEKRIKLTKDNVVEIFENEEDKNEVTVGKKVIGVSDVNGVF